MAYTVRRDFFCKCHRHNLFGGRNKTPRFFHNMKNGLDSFFYDRQPPLIHNLVENTVFLLQGIVARLYHLKKILEVPVVFQFLDPTGIFGI